MCKEVKVSLTTTLFPTIGVDGEGNALIRLVDAEGRGVLVFPLWDAIQDGIETEEIGLTGLQHFADDLSGCLDVVDEVVDEELAHLNAMAGNGTIH